MHYLKNLFDSRRDFSIYVVFIKCQTLVVVYCHLKLLVFHEDVVLFFKFGKFNRVLDF